MNRRVIHEHKIPRSITIVLYVIAIATTLNLAKPFIGVSPASAEIFGSDLNKIERYLRTSVDYLDSIAGNTRYLRYM